MTDKSSMRKLRLKMKNEESKTDDSEREEVEAESATKVCTRSLTPKFLNKILLPSRSLASDFYSLRNQKGPLARKGTDDPKGIDPLAKNRSSATHPFIKLTKVKSKNNSKESLPDFSISINQLRFDFKVNISKFVPHTNKRIDPSLSSVDCIATRARSKDLGQQDPLSELLNSQPQDKPQVIPFDLFKSKYSRAASSFKPILKQVSRTDSVQSAQMRPRAKSIESEIKRVRFSKKLLYCVYNTSQVPLAKPAV